MSFPGMAHSMHGQDPQLFTKTVAGWSQTTLKTADHSAVSRDVLSPRRLSSKGASHPSHLPFRAGQ